LVVGDATKKTSYRLWPEAGADVAIRGVPASPKHRKIVGDAIRAARKDAGLSQEKLAEKADLHPNYIGEVERGEKNIAVDALMRIAAALKVSVTRFFPGL
jgi:ribosome-binding protein aMBF1 (putative translation factor)